MQWAKSQTDGSSHQTEEEFNEQFDQEQLDRVHEGMAELNQTKIYKKSGDGPTGQDHRSPLGFHEETTLSPFLRQQPGKEIYQLPFLFLVPIAKKARTIANYSSRVRISLSLSLTQHTHNAEKIKHHFVRQSATKLLQ
jgi:hypothetical protein